MLDAMQMRELMPQVREKQYNMQHPFMREVHNIESQILSTTVKGGKCIVWGVPTNFFDDVKSFLLDKYYRVKVLCDGKGQKVVKIEW